MRALLSILTVAGVSAVAWAGPMLDGGVAEHKSVYSSELLQRLGFSADEVAAGSLARLANTVGDAGYRTTSWDQFGNLSEARVTMSEMARVVQTPHRSAFKTARAQLSSDIEGMLRDAMAVSVADVSPMPAGVGPEVSVENLVDPAGIQRQHEDLLSSMVIGASSTLAMLSF